MNTIFFQTIRAAAVLCVAMLAFTGEVFAAYSLLPVYTSDIGSTSVVLNGYAESYDEHSFVWFEWSEASSMSAPTVFAMRGFYGGGLFRERLGGLTPGVTYSFRSALRTAGGAVTYSPTVSFKTLGDSIVSGTAASSQGSLGLGVLSGTTDTSSGSSAQNTSSNTSNTQTQRVTSIKKNTTVPTDTKNIETTPVGTGSSTNGGANAAAVIGAGNDILPVTLIGWVALIISVLVIVLIIMMIFESTEKRKQKPVPPHLEMAEAKA